MTTHTRLPLYQWRCLHCHIFLESEAHHILQTPYGVPLRLCHQCQHPLALVRVKWTITRQTKKSP